MIDHISLGTTRYAQAVAFYRDVLAPLDVSLLRDTGHEAAFGRTERWSFFLYPVDGAEAVVAKGTHLAFCATSRDVVRAIHAKALACSARDIFSPRERPDISATYFGAMFKDLDGHSIEILSNTL
ncbi:VOC family protein [soil metagenome]